MSAKKIWARASAERIREAVSSRTTDAQRQETLRRVVGDVFGQVLNEERGTRTASSDVLINDWLEDLDSELRVSVGTMRDLREGSLKSQIQFQHQLAGLIAQLRMK